MKAKELVEFVEHESSRRWANSDLWSETQVILEHIATHFQEGCQECREEFNAMNYPDYARVIEEIERDPDLRNWVCEKYRY